MMAPNMIFAHENTVELYRRPDLVINDIRDALNDYPDEEKKNFQI